LEFGFFFGLTNLGFLLREKLAAVLIIPSSWGSQLDGDLHHHHHSNPDFFWHRCQGKRKILQGEFRMHILYFVLSFALLLLASFYQKYKKNSFLYSWFYLLAFSLVRLSNPEVKVCTFKQQGGESLKDAWYRISDSHHMCTKKHSTMILLRNFYVGITSWYRYVLDTLAGGNFLDTPAVEACTLIESLVGVPSIHVVKTKVTLEEVLEKLSSLEKSLPNILDNASHVNKLIESIGKRITILEASTTLDSQNLRIGKLEESMETSSSIFSSLKFKKEKAFVGKEQKFMYVPKVSVPKPQHVFKIGKAFSSTKRDLQVESSSRTSKMPSVVSGDLEEAVDLNASFDNT
jgi:DNA-directed RNA polymerase subunit H (RpoH/RPB5)